MRRLFFGAWSPSGDVDFNLGTPVAGWTVGGNSTELTGCNGERAIGRTVHLDRDLAHTKRMGKTCGQMASRQSPALTLYRVPKPSPSGDDRGAWVCVGLAVLVGLTTWAVASISVWMAPLISR